MGTRSGGFGLSGAKAVVEREGEGLTVHMKDEVGDPLYYKDEHGEEQPVEIDVVGTYSPLYRRAMQSIRTRAMKHARRGTPDAQRALDEAIRLVAKCCLAWRGIVWDNEIDDVVDIPFDLDNVMAVLRAADWFVEQLDAAMNDHQDFIKPVSQG